jgi:thioredoxin reductase (NADPH)
MYDIAIIGGGPAGLSAAITARLRDKQVIVISNDFHVSRLARAEFVDNYPGMPHISGVALLEAMHRQAVDLGVAFLEDRVISVLPFGERFSITTASDLAEAKTLVLAVGLDAGKAYPGEMDYLGRGVSYCATCDGMLYRDKTVVVVGLSDDAPHEATFLDSIGCHVTYLAASPMTFPDGSIVVRSGRVSSITGDALGVTGLVYRPLEGDADFGVSEESTLVAEGVFILRPSIAPSALVSGIALDGRLLKVDDRLSTNIPGVFAAGDCATRPAQVAKAVGEGQVAALSAVAYLDAQVRS